MQLQANLICRGDSDLAVYTLSGVTPWGDGGEHFHVLDGGHVVCDAGVSY